MYFFGSLRRGEAGLFLYEMSVGRATYSDGEPHFISGHTLNGLSIDGGYVPADVEQSAAKLTYAGQYTVLSIRDYTGDARAGCHSTFIHVGVVDYDAMIQLIHLESPEVIARIIEEAPIALVQCAVHPVASMSERAAVERQARRLGFTMGEADGYAVVLLDGDARPARLCLTHREALAFMSGVSYARRSS